MEKKSGGRRMEYTLMHKEIPVMGLEIDSATCAVQKIGEIYAAEHIPPGTLGYDKKTDRTGPPQQGGDGTFHPHEPFRHPCSTGDHGCFTAAGAGGKKPGAEPFRPVLDAPKGTGYQVA